MPIIDVRDLTYIYCAGTAYERKSLDNVSLMINKGDVIGIVGRNGSGKSTLIKHFNGLLVPTQGKVYVMGKDTSDRKSRNELWKNVGMVFQFPEKQLFEETVYNEIAYGLQNLDVAKDEIPDRIRESLLKVGLEDESILKYPPISLSGGLRRRVALASILAMDPEILVMDEPTAGLDAVGRQKIIDVIQEIKSDGGRTIILVSHNMNELISLCTHLGVLEDGRLVAYGKKEEVLCSEDFNDSQHCLLPGYIQLVRRLSKYNGNVNTHIMNMEQAETELNKFFGDFYEKS